MSEGRDTDVTRFDMLGLHAGTADEARRIWGVAEKRIGAECYPTDDLDVRKYLAWLHLWQSIQGKTDAPEVEFFQDHVIRPSETEDDPGMREWLAGMEADGRKMGVENVPSFLDTAPLVFSVAMQGNLPTRICGSDALAAYQMMVDDLAIDSLDDLLEDADASEENPLSFKWAVWVIFVMFILEFGMLFVLKSIAGVFSKWPLKIIYIFLRKLAIKVFRRIRDYAFTKVLHVPGMNEGDDESLRQMQIQKILLFANGNPLVDIGAKLGLC